MTDWGAGRIITRMANEEMMRDYTAWLQGLSPDELENERYTVEHEWLIIGMQHADAEARQWACKTETERRASERLS